MQEVEDEFEELQDEFGHEEVLPDDVDIGLLVDENDLFEFLED